MSIISRHFFSVSLREPALIVLASGHLYMELLFLYILLARILAILTDDTPVIFSISALPLPEDNRSKILNNVSSFKVDPSRLTQLLTRVIFRGIIQSIF